jgi:hypothetical protein
VQIAVLPAGVPDSATDFLGLKAAGAWLVSCVLMLTPGKH